MEDCLVGCRIASSNPLRPPDWRYRRALELLARHRPASLRSDDLATRRLLAHLRSCRRSAGSRAQAACDRRDPAIADAVELFTRGDALRSVVEAWLLAAAPPAEIAERTCVSMAGIEAYHACFFDVGDRLARPDYIVGHVILTGASSSAAARPIETAIRLAAYLGGPRALAGLLPTRPPKSEEFAALLVGIERINDGLFALLKHLALHETSGVSERVTLESVAHSARLRALQHSDDELNNYERNVKEILDCVQFQMRQRDDIEKCPPELRPYFYGPVEMRADEVTRYNLTGELPPIEEFTGQFPQPSAREAGEAAGDPSNA
jgi:hypothetical protein